jgi:CRP-like cAMP-binding protein
VLRAAKMFEGLTLNSISKLSYYWKKVTFSRRQLVYREGEPSSNIYIAIEGEFRLCKTIGEARDERMSTIRKPC